MKAIVLSKYGSPESLQVQDVEKPIPKEGEVLVRIKATAVNDYDWSMVLGKPFIYRLMFGLFKPKHSIPGMELSGVVESLGKGVQKFREGDHVYGDISSHGFGTFAEYICINEDAMVLKPENISFEEATTIPHAAMLASQGLIDEGEIQKGQKILVNGAGGGMGLFALQIAKTFDAEVTGVDTGGKLKDMLALGYDHVIDYEKENFTKSGELYDLVLDAKTVQPAFRYLRSLKPHGKYITVGGHLNRLLEVFLLGPVIKKFSQKQIKVLGLKTNKDLDYMHQLVNEGQIKYQIDGPYPLEDAPKQIQRFGEGKHSGKVVILIS